MAKQTKKMSLAGAVVVTDLEVPDYSGESTGPSDDQMARLNRLVLAAAKLEVQKARLDEELKTVGKELTQYKEKLIPELMAEMGMSTIVTASGVKIEIKEEVRAAFPKDQERRNAAFAYLKETGDDAIIKRQFVVQYGKGEIAWAEEFSKQLVELKVAEHATVEEDWSVHHQTLLAYLRTQLKEGRPVPMESFGAFVQSIAKIKLAGG